MTPQDLTTHERPAVPASAETSRAPDEVTKSTLINKSDLPECPYCFAELVGITDITELLGVDSATAQWHWTKIHEAHTTGPVQGVKE